MIGSSRNRRRHARRASATDCACGALAAPLIARVRRSWMKLPTMTTPIRMTPWATTARFGSKPRNVMSVRISWRMTTATIGPKMPPRPPARLTPPRTTAATLEQRVGPGNRRPDPGAGRQRRARRARRTGPVSDVGDDLRPADRDAAAECGQLVAADGVDRQAEPGPPERDPDRPRRRRSARPPPWGSTRCRATRSTRSLSHCAAPPPGRRARAARSRPRRTTSPGSRRCRAPA